MQAWWMLLASLLFAAMGVCVKLAAQQFSVAEIVFYRAFISLLLMLALIRLRGIALATPHWRLQLSRGLFGFVALYAYFQAIAWLPLATAITLNYTSSLFLALGLIFLGRYLHWPTLLSLVCGFAGVVVLLRPSWQEAQMLGGVIGLMSGMLAAVAVYNVRELGARGEAEARTVFYFSLVASVCAAPGLLFSEGARHVIDAAGGLTLLGVGAFAAAAQLAMTRAYSRGHTLSAAALGYSAVVFASLFGALFFAETLDVLSWVGMALIIVAGVATSRFARAAPVESD